MSDNIYVLPAVADIAGGEFHGLWECVAPGPNEVLLTGLGDDFAAARRDLALKVKESGMLPEDATHVRILATTRKTFALDEL